MIHGFTSSPNIFRPLAAYLQQKLGWEIQVPLLPAHGLTYRKLDQVTAQEWVVWSEQELLKLSSRFSKVHLLGMSMGGTLCAHLATRYPDQVASLTLLTPALYFRKFWERFFRPVVRLMPRFLLKQWIIHKESSNHAEKISYQRYSVASVMELDKICQLVKHEFRSDVSGLVMVSLQDQTIHPKSSHWFYRRLTNRNRKLVELSKSPHIIFLGDENEKIFSEIENFLKSV